MQGCRVHNSNTVDWVCIQYRFCGERFFFFYVKPDHELSLSAVSLKTVGVPIEQYSKMRFLCQDIHIVFII